MAYNPQNNGASGGVDLDLIDEGIHNARLVRVIELGEHGDKYGVKARAVMGFLLPGYTMELNGEQKQRMVWTFEMNQAENKDCTFNKYCRAINPQATCIEDILDRPCTVELVHKEKDGNTYVNLTNVVRPMAGSEIPPADCDVYYFDWDNPSKEVWDMLSEKRQDRIKEAENYNGSATQAMLEGRETDSPI